MKKVAAIYQKSEAILSDEELRSKIEQLVELANEKGFLVSHLAQAVRDTWKEIIPEEEIIYELSSEEKDFTTKVEKFMKYYGNNLEECYHQVYMHENNTHITKNLREILKNTMIALYLVLGREKECNQMLVSRYGRRYLNYKLEIIMQNPLHIIRMFFTQHLIIKEDSSELPVYERRENPKNSIMNNMEFMQFRNSHPYRDKTTHEVAVMTVWFISKYF